ncbi:hypothetical protein U1Q18_049513, partial [Sarracenia purpurea var. burkii]
MDRPRGRKSSRIMDTKGSMRHTRENEIRAGESRHREDRHKQDTFWKIVYYSGYSRWQKGPEGHERTSKGARAVTVSYIAHSAYNRYIGFADTRAKIAALAWVGGGRRR